MQFNTTKGIIKFDMAEGIINFNTTVGIVNFTATEGIIKFSTTEGIVNFTKTDGIINFITTEGIIDFSNHLLDDAWLAYHGYLKIVNIYNYAVKSMTEVLTIIAPFHKSRNCYEFRLSVK